MERRFALFLVLTVLLWTGYIALRFYLVPPDEPVAEQVDPAKEKHPGKLDPAPEIARKGKARELADQDKKRPDEESRETPTTADGGPVAADSGVQQWMTLGSLDPKSPYRMLVMFDSRGAAVARVELNSDRYKAIDDATGYFGHLAFPEHAGAAPRIGVVGPGTPAARAEPADNGAKLAVGDVITAVDKQPVEYASTFEELIKKTRPGQTITLEVMRQGKGKPVTFTAKLERRPLEVVRPEGHTYTQDDGTMKILPRDPFSLLLTLESIGARSIRPLETEIPGLPSLRERNWTIDEQGEDFIQFSFPLDESALGNIDKEGSLKVVKRYTLKKQSEKGNDPGYILDLRVEIHNTGEQQQAVAYRLDGPTGLPLEGWWYSAKLHPKMWDGAGARDVVWKVGHGHRLLGCPRIVSESKAAIADKKPPTLNLLEGDQAQPVEYAGVDTQFFASAIVPQNDSDKEPLKFRRAEALPVQDVTEIPKNRLKTTNVTVRLVSDVARLEPGGKLAHDYRVFFGPKEPDVLETYELEPLVEFGWPIFKYPAQLLQFILTQLYGLTGNYGIAIILLTVIVRSCMVPISLKQARSAAMMQQLAPEMAKIKEKYPDDPMKQHTAVQELYKKYNFNPFGGCLLVFLQLPIFIGLYRCLSVDIDLRDAPLFGESISWASNLAGPDKLFYWKDYVWAMIGDEASGWFGPYFNVLPLVTVTLFLIQQKMFTPPATDEQTRMQQQMMTYMTVFMGVMFYKVPAGLCLYFITSSLWGICERKLLPKIKPPPSDTTAVVATKPIPKPSGSNGSAGTSAGKKKQKKR